MNTQDIAGRLYRASCKQVREQMTQLTHGLEQIYDDMESLILAGMAAGIPADRIAVRRPDIRFDDVRHIAHVEGGVYFLPEVSDA